MRLLQGRPLAELEAALRWAGERAAGSPEALLIVYLSGHADASAGMLPGGEVLPWTRLKALVAATGAKARVTIVDGCQASGLLEASARPTSTFDIALDERLTVKGDVFITSSAADEPSVEAGQYRGSVFTQHLVAGLRGAADVDGDGDVTVEEAYRYAYLHTTRGQSGQHPGVANRLSGFGSLTLSSLSGASGLLVPAGLRRLAVRDAKTREPLVVLYEPSGGRLALAPGAVLLEVDAVDGACEGPLEVRRGRFSSFDVAALRPTQPALGLVRLGGASPCYDITADAHPGAARVVERLRAVLPDCTAAQQPVATLSVGAAGPGTLRVACTALSIDEVGVASRPETLADTVTARLLGAPKRKR